MLCTRSPKGCDRKASSGESRSSWVTIAKEATDVVDILADWHLGECLDLRMIRGKPVAANQVAVKKKPMVAHREKALLVVVGNFR